MKRIALLLAAVGLGAGCTVSTCDPQTLTVDWRFVDSTGVANLPCSDAIVGADWVDIFVDGTQYARVACTAYSAVLSGIPTGGHEVVVEGIQGGTSAGGGAVITRDWVSPFNIASCGDTLFHASPGEAQLQLAYDFSPVNACGAPPTYMWYSLTDTIAGTSTGIGNGQLCSVNATASNQCASTVASATPFVLTTLSVPYGRYRLDWLNEVAVTGSTYCTGSTLYKTCAATTADVVAPTPSLPVPITATLYTATTCP